MYMYSYRQASKSSKDLANALGIRRIRHKNSTFRGNEKKIVINWGSSNLPDEVNKCRVLNKPESVELCSNKLKFFHCIKQARIPEWTQSIEDAKKWVEGGKVVFARTKLTGNSGEGIVEVEDVEGMVEAPLYTLYVPKRNEYRVHIFQGEVMSVQRKALRGDVDKEKVNWRIRNMNGGFIFARNEDKEIPEDVIEQAKIAFGEVGLDFGSVDVIYNEGKKQAFVLEINTASGLAGTTLQEYVDKFKEIGNV